MTRSSKAFALFAFFLSGLATACANDGRVQVGAGTSSGAQPAWAATGPLVVRSARLALAPRLLREAATTRLELQTPEGKALNLVRIRQERIGERGIAWHGRVENDAGSTAVIVENGGAVAGTIFTSTGQYRLGGEEGRVVIERIDSAQFPREGEPIARSGRAEAFADPAADTCTTDSGADIDVMVVYTDDTRAAAGGTAAMEAEVYLAVAVSNQTYVNSNVTQRLRLVHTVEVNYAETGNANTDLNWLQGNAGIQTLRNTFAADNVVMLTQTSNYCGLAYFMSSVGNGFNPYAYGVVLRSCASGNLSFPHELGHNMSAAHDWSNDAGTLPYLFGHGFQKPTPSVSVVQPWRTVMAYACSGVTCGRIPYWSNPNVFYPGPTADAMGVTGGTQPADNAQVLNLTALTVANFRCSSAGRADVWMKDRWNDTGAEPEPLTAGLPMWESPYIWIRNSQDATLAHQHEHQNPEFGSPNWAYVKLHNGGPARTGNLELWVAQASAGLTWQGSWTQVGSIPTTIAAGSTRIVEVPWPTLPGTGHYCLVARWVAASDPMNTEGPDINANTIANNNIVWRNVNIVTPDPLETFSMRIENPTRLPTRTTLRFHLPRNANQRSFASVGEMEFELDERLASLAAENVRPVGLVRTRRGWSFARDAEVAELSGLLLDPGQGGVVNVRLRRTAGSAPADVYRLRVEQWRDPRQGDDREAAAGPLLVGGVSYDIRTGGRTVYVPPRGQ